MYEIRRTTKADPAAFEAIGWTDDLQEALSHSHVGEICNRLDGRFDVRFQVWDDEAKAYAYDGLTQYLRCDRSADKNAPIEIRNISEGRAR